MTKVWYRLKQRTNSANVCVDMSRRTEATGKTYYLKYLYNGGKSNLNTVKPNIWI